MSSRTIGLLCCILCAGLSLTLPACSRPSSPSVPPPAARQQTDVAEVPKIAYTSPTKEEAMKFAEEMQAAVYRGDGREATNLLDWDAVLLSTTKGIEAPPGFEKGFLTGARRQATNGAFGQQLVDTVQNGGSFRLLRIHEEGGETRALFRLLQPEAGVNYQDFILAKFEDGDVRATDVYIYLSAERFSQTMRRMYLTAVAGQPDTVLEKMMGKDSAFVTHAKEFSQMANSLQTGRFQECVDVFNDLPAEMQNEKTVMLLYVQAAGQLEEQIYVDAIDRFRKAHPRDPCLDMISIDAYLLRGKFDEAIASVDRLEEALGGDPYCDALRSNVSLAKNDMAAARQFAMEAIEADPQLEDPYWSLVTVALAEEDYAETAKVLDLISERLGLEFRDLSSIPEYSGFVASPEYQKWLDGQSAQ